MFWQGILRLLPEAGLLFVHFIVLVVGSFLAYYDVFTLGTVVAFFTLLMIVSLAWNRLASIWPDLVTVSPALLRVESLLAESPRTTDAASRKELPTFSEAIRFQSVTVSHTDEQINLDDVTFTITAGLSVALVGTKDSGKHEIPGLISHLYDPQSGKVSIDGYDLRDVSRDSITAQVAVINSTLFSMSVRENIRLGKPDASDEQVGFAATSAGAHDLITSLPNGYDTVIGENDVQLTAGQRLLIVLARAFLRDPRILILEQEDIMPEPALETEITNVLKKLRQHRTVISLSNRPEDVSSVDEVLVFDNGELVERGTHTALLEKGGIYARLLQKQSGFTFSADRQRMKVQPDRLRLIPLFENTTNALLEAIAKSFVSHSVEQGRTIYAAGEHDDTFYMIARGSVEVTTLDEQGEEMSIATLDDGDYFGEDGLAEDIVRTTSVHALTPCYILTLQRGQLLNLMDETPSLRPAIEQLLEEQHTRALPAPEPAYDSTPAETSSEEPPIVSGEVTSEDHSEDKEQA
jgi:ABC-type branched-subunit amino acid transport system ATPase component